MQQMFVSQLFSNENKKIFQEGQPIIASVTFVLCVLVFFKYVTSLTLVYKEYFRLFIITFLDHLDTIENIFLRIEYVLSMNKDGKD
jgi:hypothetical protein